MSAISLNLIDKVKYLSSNIDLNKKINLKINKISEKIFNQLKKIFRFDDLFLSEEKQYEEILICKINEGSLKKEDLSPKDLNIVKNSMCEGAILAKIQLFDFKNFNSFQ
ncbi:hypothetical protein LR002_03060 [Candidatus Gracilibacteria bacterium]|nr:hypothetical protein [Candidatus Gracilibacteria bacterium]